MKRAFWIAAVLAVLVVSGCGGKAAETATGIVIGVHQTSPVAVQGFTLRQSDGTQLDFRIGQLQIDAGSFNAGHLLVHEITGLPITVAYHLENGQRVAFRLVDAPHAT